MRFLFLFLSISFLLLTSCQSDKSDLPPADIESKWVLTAMNEDALDASQLKNSPFIRLDTTRSNFRGNSGCNPMEGDFSLNTSSQKINFRKVLIASKKCKNSIDKKLGKHMYAINGYKIEGNTLYLTQNGKRLLTFETIDN